MSGVVLETSGSDPLRPGLPSPLNIPKLLRISQTLSARVVRHTSSGTSASAVSVLSGIHFQTELLNPR